MFEWQVCHSSSKCINVIYIKADPTRVFHQFHHLLEGVICISLSMMHKAATLSGSASSVNFLNIFNILFIISISSGTNNARLAAMLRQLAQYHAKDPNNLFMVRLAQVGGHIKGTVCQTPVNFWVSVWAAIDSVLFVLPQGLTHLGKGTLTLCPYHSDRQLMSQVAVAGLLTVLVSFLDVKNSKLIVNFSVRSQLPQTLHLVSFCFVMWRFYSVSDFSVLIFSLCSLCALQ